LEDDVSHRIVLAALAAVVAVAASGCGSTQAHQDMDDKLLAIASATATADVPPPPSKPGDDEDKLTKDQKEQMEVALRRGGDKAANCSSVVPDSPTGEGEVKVTFDGDKGRATQAVVGNPFAGTSVETCIQRAFVGEIIVPFSGSLEVPYTVKLPPHAGAATDKDKKGNKKK
jgi:hypothetical protein